MKYSINGQRRLMSLIEPVFLAHWADRLLARLPLFFFRCLESEKRGPPLLWFRAFMV